MMGMVAVGVGCVVGTTSRVLSEKGVCLNSIIDNILLHSSNSDTRDYYSKNLSMLEILSYSDLFLY